MKVAFRTRFSWLLRSLVTAGLFVSCALVFNPALAASVNYVSTANGKGYFKLAAFGKSAPLYCSNTDYPGVLRALADLQADIKAVTKSQPLLSTGPVAPAVNAVFVGTIGKSVLIDQLIRQKKIDVTSITGKWEAHITEVVKNPMPGIASALVIVGSDKRGSIYGIYDLSAQIGVSPWYWWADVPIKEHTNLYVIPGKYSDGEPAVKYRGIFINDEAPAFSGWAKEKFGGINHNVYQRVFELILRLKGNYLWPAMWGNAFNDDDKINPELADEYGIVMGTSHHEPMDRAQQEWKRYGKGAWNYETNGEVLRAFWKKGIENMGSKETIVTVGMRGDGDKPMTEGSNINLLETIVNDQRKIIAAVTGKDAAQTPQMWALYKEVQDYYDKGMRVPDDVTLLLCDDNWGNIRKLPGVLEPKRKGGYGIYYHFDYVGGPRNYKWLNTNPISKVWEQMHLAYAYNARQVWVVNVGDLKPMEFPISFFLDYAWAPEKLPQDKLKQYTISWARQQFGPLYAEQIANLLSKYTKYNGRRKPELLDEHTYSLTNYREFENVVADYNQLKEEAERLNKLMSSAYRDAYYELVLHPIQACANLNELYFAAAKNKWYAQQARAATNDMFDRVKTLYAKDAEISNYYNKILAGGKWNHMMDQTHIGYMYWQEPRTNKIPETVQIELPPAGDMGLSIEGSASWWPNEKGEATLPAFDRFGISSHYIEVFNRGRSSFNYSIVTGTPWIHVRDKEGLIDKEKRIWVTIDSGKVPKGIRHLPIIINGPNKTQITVQAIINNNDITRPKGALESDGYVSIEAAHYSKAINSTVAKWINIPDYGRTLSGVTITPVTGSRISPGGKSPHLEYYVNLTDTGKIAIAAYLSPTIDFTNSIGLHYAISLDDEQPQVVNINADSSIGIWNKEVASNIKIITSYHHITRAGVHVLKFWAVDPAVVLQKLVLNLGGERPSYLGPPENYRAVTRDRERK